LQKAMLDVDAAQQHSSFLQPAAQHRLLLHGLAAIEVLLDAAVATSQIIDTKAPVETGTGSVLPQIAQLCMSCLRTVIEHPLPAEGSTLLTSPPLADAAAALLARMQQHGNKVVSPPHYECIKVWLASGGAAERRAVLTALLVSLEARQKPCVPARAVPDILAQLLHNLVDSPLARPTRSSLLPVPCALQHAEQSITARASQDLDEACSEAVLCLRCAESIVAQAATFRKLGPAGPALLSSACSIMQAIQTQCVRAPAAASSNVEGLLLVIMGLCALVSSVVRNREDVVKATWHSLAAFTTAALHSLVALQRVQTSCEADRFGDSSFVSVRALNRCSHV
jgi:hypothetical protein